MFLTSRNDVPATSSMFKWTIYVKHLQRYLDKDVRRGDMARQNN